MIIKNLLKNKKVEKTPIWIMRQAGRHLPEYREIRKKNVLLDIFFSPEIVEEVTLQPIRRYDLDAAIIFSDILVIPYALGMNLNFGSNSKPTLDGIDKMSKKLNKEFFKQRLSDVYKSISLVKKEIKDKKPLIGFSGGAWTLYLYMMSGGSSASFPQARASALENFEQTKEIISLLSDAIFFHLEEQIKAGADIVKIFESEAGSVTDLYFEDFIIKPTKKVVSKLKKEYPEIKIICFPRGASFRYKYYSDEIDSDVIAVDYFTPAEWAKKNISGKIIQGNLDPALLFSSKENIKTQVDKIENIFGKGKYIFNLGHGILPTTPVENVQFLVDYLRGDA